MTPHQYLEAVLDANAFDENERPVIEARRSEVETLIRSKFTSDIQTIKYSGSLAKGTAIRSSHDIDIAIHFKRDSDFDTLEEMYDEVFEVLEAAYAVRRQRVSIGLEGLDVDVVPGRRINPDDSADNDVFLYRTDGGERIKTNIEKQKTAVSESGVRENIKLAKVWRDRWGLRFKSFGLELLVMRALSDFTGSGLDRKMEQVLRFAVDNVTTMRLMDPGNTANDVASTIGDTEKKLVKATANSCLEFLSKLSETSSSDEVVAAWRRVFAEETSGESGGSSRLFAVPIDYRVHPDRTHGGRS